MVTLFTGCISGDLSYEGGEPADSPSETREIAEVEVDDTLETIDETEESPETEVEEVEEVEEVSPPDGTPGECGMTSNGKATEDFVKSLYQKTCNELFNCGDTTLMSQFFQLRGVGSKGGCRTVLHKVFGSPAQFAAAASAGHLKLDTCQMSTCLDAMGQRSCARLLRFAQDGDFRRIASCESVIQGQKKAGDDCTFGEQCGRKLTCEGDDESSCGKSCQKVDHVLRGARCGNSRCGGDQYCDTSRSLCVSRKPDGESCDRPEVCATNTQCKEGTCNQIESGLSKSASCNTSNKLCRPGLICDAAGGKTCVEPSGEGGDCPTRFECKPDLYCNDSFKCQPAKSKSDSCSEGRECASGTCIDGKCLGSDELCGE